MMEVIADLHVHSRFAMACSTRISLESMEAAALEKGLNLIGTGDFTHPEWLKEIKSSLEPIDETGLFRLKGSRSGVMFVLSAEVATIFGHKRVHNCALMPSIESVDALNDELATHGDLKSDGRPALTMGAAEFVEAAVRTSGDAFVFPAHAWTPWFGVFGSFSGFDSMKDAYEDQEGHIRALETGLSSDPVMNWRVSSLDKYALVSNSDMHSVEKIGREANVLSIDGKVTYRSVIGAICNDGNKAFKRTIEFYPEEGKYHYDGHRQCNYSVNPETSKATKCPVCGKRLVIGVLHRVNDLADRPPGFVKPGAVPYVHMVPLREVIAYATKKTTYSQVVASTYRSLVPVLGNEFDVLENVAIEAIEARSNSAIARAIRNVRDNMIHIAPGYDGVFGKLELLEQKPESAPAKPAGQRGMSDFVH